MSDARGGPSIGLDGTTPFACTWHDGGASAAWVRIAGEVDLATAPQLAAALEQAQRDVLIVVVDLREVTFMDSAGLRVLMEADSRAVAAACRLVCVRGSRSLSRLFAIAGLEEHLKLVDLDPAEPPAQALLCMPEESMGGGRVGDGRARDGGNR